jgi:hypothetical protein
MKKSLGCIMLNEAKHDTSESVFNDVPVPC